MKASTAAAFVIASFACAGIASAEDIHPRMVKALKELRSDDGNARHNAAIDICNLGRARIKPALPELVKALDNPDVTVKRTLLRAISYLGPDAKPAMPKLHALLKDGGQDVMVRAGAAFAIGLIGEEAAVAVPDLVKAAGAGNPNLKRAGIRALGEIGPKAVAGVPVLTRALADSDMRTARQAFVSLGDIGSGAISAAPELIARLKGADERAVKSIGLALGKMGPGVVPKLLEAAGSDVAEARAGAVLALGGVKPPQKEHVAVLIKVAGEEATFVRICAAMGLERMGPDAAPAVEVLRGLLKSDDNDIKRRAVIALGSIGPAAKAAIPEITKRMDDYNASVARAAGRALGKMSK